MDQAGQSDVIFILESTKGFFKTTERCDVVSYESTRDSDKLAGMRSESMSNNVVVEWFELGFSCEVAGYRRDAERTGLLPGHRGQSCI